MSPKAQDVGAAEIQERSIPIGDIQRQAIGTAVRAADRVRCLTQSVNRSNFDHFGDLDRVTDFNAKVASGVVPRPDGAISLIVPLD